MVDLDFRRNICTRDKLAVWFAFWGERKFRPTYRRICAERDKSYDDMARVMCAKLCEEGDYPDVGPGAGRRRRCPRSPTACGSTCWCVRNR